MQLKHPLAIGLFVIARKYAEDIMDIGKAKAYYHATKWLEKVKAAYLASGQESV